MTNRFTVIRDTREKKGHGWFFEDDGSYCEGTSISKLDVGDYSIDGLEHMLCIERKESVSEFAKNSTEKRFYRELQRMSSFPYSFLIFEFNWLDLERYPHGTNIPEEKWLDLKIGSKYMKRVISSIRIEHGVHVIACGDKKRAETTAFRIMRKVHEIHG